MFFIIYLKNISNSSQQLIIYNNYFYYINYVGLLLNFLSFIENVVQSNLLQFLAMKELVLLHGLGH